MIDKTHIGARLAPHEALIEAGRLRFFAKATGQTDPIYRDEAAARAAGWRGLPAPPTFLFCLSMEKPNPYDWVDLLGIDLGKVLHGEQSFDYRKIACAGDRLRFQLVVEDIYDKRNGSLEFVHTSTEVTDQNDDAVATLRSVTVVRQ